MGRERTVTTIGRGELPQDRPARRNPIDPRELDVPVVVLSHRAPLAFYEEGGSRRARRGAGGLVTALVGLAAQLNDAVWVCAASTDEDVVVAREYKDASLHVSMGPRPAITSPDAEGCLEIRFVETDPVAHEDFYSVISNPLLWFIQHGLYELSYAPNIGQRERDAFEDGYVNVNQTFADAVAREVEQ